MIVTLRPNRTAKSLNQTVKTAVSWFGSILKLGQISNLKLLNFIKLKYVIILKFQNFKDFRKM